MNAVALPSDAAALNISPGNLFTAARDLQAQVYEIETSYRTHQTVNSALLERRHMLQQSLQLFEAVEENERAERIALDRELHEEMARTGQGKVWDFDFRFDVPSKAVALLGTEVLADAAAPVNQGRILPIFQGCVKHIEERLALVPKGYVRMDESSDGTSGGKKLMAKAKTLAGARRYVAEKMKQRRRSSWEDSGKHRRKRRVSKSQIVHKGLIMGRT